MNMKRILLGGLAAGVLINIGEGILYAGILMNEQEAMMAAHDLIEPGWAPIIYPIGAFIIGFVLAWLYAAVRPRFGAGWKTAARVGVATFLVCYLVPATWFGAMGLLLSAGSTTLALFWGLAEMLIAALIAGWLYQEVGEAAAAPAPREPVPATTQQ